MIKSPGRKLDLGLAKLSPMFVLAGLPVVDYVTISGDSFTVLSSIFVITLK